MTVRAIATASRRARCGPTGKLRFTDREAKDAIRRLREKGTDGVIYVCRDCAWHHVASQADRNHQERRKAAERRRLRTDVRAEQGDDDG